MSFSQQSRSDLAAADADRKRLELEAAGRRSLPRPETPTAQGRIARLRAWIQRLLVR